jgi:hypothetical protein
MEVSIDFSDITMASQEGVFEDVQKIMIKTLSDKEKWMIRTSATISTQYGYSEMVLHFYGDAKVYIIEYSSSSNDVFYNPDISGISLWAQQNGWKIPEPQRDLIAADKVFWKHFWETNVIDSDYFDSLYGKRQVMLSEDKGDEDG